MVERYRTYGEIGECDNCGKTFTATRWRQRFCSGKCKGAWHNAVTAKARAEYKQRTDKGGSDD